MAELEYYNLKLKNGSEFKGDCDKTFSNFGLSCIRQDNTLYLNIPCDMRREVVLDVCLSKEGVNLKTKKGASVIYWEINSNNQMEDTVNQFCIFFNEMTENIFKITKYDIKLVIKRLIFNKTSRIDSFIIFVKEELLKASNTMNKLHNELKGKIKKSDDYDSMIIYHRKIVSEHTDSIKALVLDLFNKVKDKAVNMFISGYNQEEFTAELIEEKYLINLSSTLLKIGFTNVSNKFLLLYDKNNGIFELRLNQSTLIKRKDMLMLLLSNDSGQNIIYNHGIETKWLYVGELDENFDKQGFGLEKWLDGFNEVPNINEYYLGEYKKNKFEGKGGILNTVDFYYQGNFKDGKKDGVCEIYFIKDKHVYQGEIKENVLEGKGRYVFGENETVKEYRGGLQKNMADGEGTMIFVNNHIFRGRFNNHIKKDVGKYITEEGYEVDFEFNDKGDEIVEKTVYKY